MQDFFLGFDENAHARKPQAGPCADGRRGILSQIPTRPVQADTHRPSPEGIKHDFTPAMEVIVRQILAELAAPLLMSSLTGTP